LALNLQGFEIALFFNPKSAIQNPKSCLNWLFVQALISTVLATALGKSEHTIKEHIA